MSIELDDLQEILTIKRRRLKHLRRQAAQFGYDCPAQTRMEIEDLEAEIASLQERIASLLPPSSPTATHHPLPAASTVLVSDLFRTAPTGNILLPRHQGPKPVIIIAEENPDLDNVLHRVIDRELRGFEVLSELDPENILGYLAARSVAMVIIGYAVGTPGAIDLAHKIKSASAGTLVVFTTGIPYEEQEQAARSAGADYYLPKPYSLITLERILEKHPDLGNL